MQDTDINRSDVAVIIERVNIEKIFLIIYLFLFFLFYFILSGAEAFYTDFP